AKAPGARGAGAIGLVEAALVDQAEAARGAHLDQGGGGLERVLATLDLTRPGDQRDRKIVADGHRPHLDATDHAPGTPHPDPPPRGGREFGFGRVSVSLPVTTAAATTSPERSPTSPLGAALRLEPHPT